MLGEKVRLDSKRATKGWIVWIIPVSIVLFVVLCFTLQKTTGIPFYDVLGLADCSASQPAECSSENDYSPTQRNIARLFIFVAIVVIAYFIYEQFQQGVGGGLMGGNVAASAVHDVRPALRREAEYTQQVTDATLMKVEMQRNQLLEGATNSTRLPAANFPNTNAASVPPAAAASVPNAMVPAPPPLPAAAVQVPVSESARAFAQQTNYEQFVPSAGSSPGAGGQYNQVRNI